jgi:hypothetical protein
VRVADGPVAAGGQHLPGGEAWLVGEHRASGERKYYLSNLAPDATLERLAALIKARWGCAQMYQQLKRELGLGHLEGRSRAALSTAWPAPPRAAVPDRVRLPAAPAARGERGDGGTRAGPPPQPSLPEMRRRILAALGRVLLRCPHCRQRFAHHLQL